MVRPTLAGKQILSFESNDFVLDGVPGSGFGHEHNPQELPPA
jgi:hypothetical protein